MFHVKHRRSPLETRGQEAYIPAMEPVDQITWDVIVIGGGHAGCEAAAASARFGARTLLLTHKAATIGEMSCNPAVGGVGKGHLVREIDALDGLMGRVADAAGIQFRLLNRSKGPAVRGPRAQSDRVIYKSAMQAALAAQANMTIHEAGAEDLILAGDGASVTGVVTDRGECLTAGRVVLTTGTFLRGLIHLGEKNWPAGRVGEAPAVGLAETLDRIGFALGRLKTGTPPRLDGRTIDWAALERQPGDEPPVPFSWLTREITTPQVACHITETTPGVHAVIRDNLTRSPIYSGQIDSTGPRYCPSIEDKIVRFDGRDRHQIFLEPEGLDTHLVYPNGISTSLPEEVQREIVSLMPGLAKVEIVRPGYAIEYDFVDPRELYPSLETRKLSGLYLAGQINGTTGYEEAAAQGLIAGLNAARAASGSAPVILGRADAYIGVMIDDLVTRGATEPYRMFTSRAEYRLTLRADNADQRLTPIGIEAGIVGGERAAFFSERMAALDTARDRLQAANLTPPEAQRHGLKVNGDGVRRSGMDLLRYPDIGFNDLVRVWPDLAGISPGIVEQLEIEAVYAGYLDRQQADIVAFRKDESVRLDPDMDYGSIAGLSNEMREKLSAARPSTLGQASRIPGVTPAALSLLLSAMRRPDRRTSA